MDELVGPELEGRVFDQLDEGDEETPGVRSVDNQPLQQNPTILLWFMNEWNEENDCSYLVICSWMASVLASVYFILEAW